MVKAVVKAGVCGFRAVIEATSPDGMNVQLTIKSDCDKIQSLAADLQEVNAFTEIFTPLKQTTVADLAAKHKLHTACVVPAGILKAVEVAAGLALPVDASISLQKEE